MEQLISSPVELRLRGFAALEARLGWVNAVRFLQLFDPGMGDYTEERSRLLAGWDAATVVERAAQVTASSPGTADEGSSEG